MECQERACVNKMPEVHVSPDKLVQMLIPCVGVMVWEL